ncbi:MAG: phosphoglycerate kinase, partial [Gemmatimonadota bacterium]|nr:phosphoglycerate kinase [Gemmatimonadota bacterium]
MAKKTLEDCPPETLADQVVVVRVDYNLPLNRDGEVVDDTRLVRTLPTIQYLVEAGAKAVLLSHLGRPGGRPDPALSLRPVAGKLEEFLGYPVGFCPMTTGPQAQEAVQGMKSGEVLLLENTRFCPEDARNDAEWAEEEISF